MNDRDVTDALRRPEGKILHTLYRPSAFEIVDVGEKAVRVLPLGGKRKLRSILISRISTITALPTSRHELRHVTLQTFPDRRNTSYIAAIVDAINTSVVER